MTTLSQARRRNYEAGNSNTVPVAAATRIFEGAAVGLVTATGYARPLTSADTFIGFATATVDNRAGSAGALNVDLVAASSVELPVTGATITDGSRPVYAADDDTFSLDGGVFIGVIKRVVCSGVAVVSFNALIETDDGARPALRLDLGTTNDTATATANTAAIQAALTAGGLVQITTPGTYYINATLTIYSNTHLILGAGVVLKLASGSKCTMLKNAAQTAATSTVTMTSSGLTVTVAWTAHGKSVNDYVAFTGANQAEYNGVWRVVSVPDANTLTFTAENTPSATPATGTITARAADSNITISGGTWDYDSANQSGTADTIAKMGIVLAYVFNPKVRDQVWYNASKYCIFISGYQDAEVQNIRVPASNSDGVHFCGPGRGTVCRNISSSGGDDVVAFTCGDYSQYEITRGEFTRALVESIWCNNSSVAAIKITGGAGPRLRDIIIRGVYGVCQSQPITVIEDTAGGATLTQTRIEKMLVEDLRCVTSNTTTHSIFVSNASQVDLLMVKGANFAPLGSQYYVYASSTATIVKLIIDGALIDASGGSSCGLVSQASTATITDIDVRGLRVTASQANAQILQINGTTTIAAISESTYASAGGQLFRVNSTAGAVALQVSNVYTLNTNNPIDFRRACDLYAINWRHAGSTPININGSGTYNLRGRVVTTAAATVGIAGGATVNNELEKAAQSITSAASITPDLGVGCAVTVTALAAGITVNNPSNVPAANTPVDIAFTQNGTGGFNVTWGTNYLFPTAWSNTGNTANTASRIRFISDGTKLVAQGANSWY